MFLIHINDLLSTNAKLFADNKSLFFVIDDSQTSANDLNKGLEMTHNCPFQWKMNFNRDSTKQVQEVFFSRKTKQLPPPPPPPPPPAVFNDANVAQSIYQKHLRIMLDSKLTFKNHINMVTTKIN